MHSSDDDVADVSDERWRQLVYIVLRVEQESEVTRPRHHNAPRPRKPRIHLFRHAYRYERILYFFKAYLEF